MIARLDKMEQLTQEYHLEKAAGFFVGQIQKRRFIRELWKKRDDDEVNKLGVVSASQFDFNSPSSDNKLSSAIIQASDISFSHIPQARSRGKIISPMKDFHD